MRHHRYWVFGLWGLGVIGAVYLSLQTVAPLLLRRNLVRWVEESCASCELKIKEVQLSFRPLAVTFTHPELRAGNFSTTHYSAQAESIRAEIRWRRLASSEVNLSSIEVRRPRVVIVEGDDRAAPSNPPEGPPSRWHWRVGKVTAREGNFEYHRVHAGRDAHLRVSEIEAEVGEVGTTAALVFRSAKGRARGLLEESGRFELKVAAPLFIEDLKVDVDLSLAGQKLEQLNPYFHVNDGIRIEGTLAHGRTVVAVRGPRLTAKVTALYSGLDIGFEKTEDRSLASAIFANVVKMLEIQDSNQGEPPQERTQSVALLRTHPETLLQFIFRGMRDAALKVTKD